MAWPWRMSQARSGGAGAPPEALLGQCCDRAGRGPRRCLRLHALLRARGLRDVFGAGGLEPSQYDREGPDSRRAPGVRRDLPARPHLPPSVRGWGAGRFGAAGSRASGDRCDQSRRGVGPDGGVLRGHLYAKSAVDIACWDILGKATGCSVATLLGGVLQADLPLYVAVPMAEPEVMADFVLRQRELGIHRFQLKLGGAPELDALRASTIAAATAGEDAIIADANGGGDGRTRSSRCANWRAWGGFSLSSLVPPWRSAWRSVTSPPCPSCLTR